MIKEKKLTEKEMVRAVMKDGDWYTLIEIGELIKIEFNKFFLATSISARIRELRNKDGENIESRSRGRGLWQYRMKVPAPAMQEKLFRNSIRKYMKGKNK